MDMRTNRLAQVVTTGEKDIKCLQINQSGYGTICTNAVFAAGSSSRIAVVDICSGFKQLQPYELESPARCLLTLENLLLSGCEDGTLTISDNDLYEHLYKLKLFEKGSVAQLLGSKDRSYLVASSQNDSPRVLEF
jgi:hypothetical protein